MTYISFKKSAQKTAVRIMWSADVAAPVVERRGDRTLLVLPRRTEKVERVEWVHQLRRGLRMAMQYGYDSVEIDFDAIVPQKEVREEYARLAGVHTALANYDFTHYKKHDDNGKRVKLRSVCFVTTQSDVRVLNTLAQWWHIVGENANEARTLANTPGSDMTPAAFATATRRLMRSMPRVRVRVLTSAQMRTARLNGVLAVGRGSSATPRFIIVEYRGKDMHTSSKNTIKGDTILLVGKGVTFDSGGIDVKPYPHATDMMMDMSGGAAVLAVVRTAAQLGIKQNVVALIPAVENMPSGSSFRPGDILTMHNGTTVEVRNTDAEGRLILADALSYGQKHYAPSLIIDVATLTGASLIALGQQASAVLSPSEELSHIIARCGEDIVDRAWPLPLWSSYDAMLKSEVADIANLASTGQDRYAGTITAAAFLKKFVDIDNVQWVHIDMAPRMTATKDEGLAYGATGAPIALLLRYLETL